MPPPQWAATAAGCGKTELANLATETGLVITVAQLPPGSCKWNQIEHRLLHHLDDWRGRPLTSHESIVQTIAATTNTTTRLTVQAELDDTL